jgi:hypothetical protein
LFVSGYVSASSQAPSPDLVKRIRFDISLSVRMSVVSGSTAGLRIVFGWAETPGGAVGEIGVRFEHLLSEAFEGVGGFGWFRFGPMLGRPEPEQSG